MVIKIISLNLGGYTDWESRKPKIIEYLNSENADIVLLQEVRFDETKYAVNQAVELNTMFNAPYEFTSSSVSRFYRPSVGEPYKEGLAVLSQKQIKNSEVFALTQMPDDKHIRLVQNIDIDDGGLSLKVSNIHLSNNQYAPNQLRELMGVLDRRGEKRIVVGDFNIANLSAHNELYKGYTASHEYDEHYVSFPSKELTIDYMLLPDEYKYKSIVVMDGLSDHVALSIEIMGQVS